MIAFLKTLLLLTAAGTLCGLFLVALRKLTKGSIPNSFLYFAWTLVIMRFAVPVNGLIPVGGSAHRAEPSVPAYSQSRQIDTQAEAAAVPPVYSHVETAIDPVPEQVTQPAPEQQNLTVPVMAAEKNSAPKAVPVPTIMLMVWCCGAAGVLLWNAVAYVQFDSLLRRMDADEKRGYGATLLKLAENSCAVPCRMTTNFTDGKKDIKERLMQIMSFKKISKAAIALALVPIIVLCGCVAALGPKAEKEPDANNVTVSNVDELLAAIAPGRTIDMEAGTYNLTEASDYGEADTSEYYHWNSGGIEGEYELCVEAVDDLSIIGEAAEILTVPRSATVLAFDNCGRLSLRGLTVGHTEATDACQGGVIWLEGCDDAVIDDCNLYGCGTVGVWAKGSRNLEVFNTNIYHCSMEGIDFADADGLSVNKCRIYDCGQAENNMRAMAAFSFSNASDITVKSCEVHDNYLYDLIGANQADVSFEDIVVRDNHISEVFCFDSSIALSGLSFTGNTVDNWIAEYGCGTITIDGKDTTEDDLTAMWGDQLSSAGVGEADAEALPVEYTGTKEIHVSTADQFTAAIASDTTIIIDVPQIDLTTCSDYGAGASEDSENLDFADRNYAWNNCYDGYELWIGNVSNFHIAGGEIVTQPRYANVLNFAYSSGVTLENVHLGHTREQGACVGGVINLQNADNFIIEGCDLYGCGVLGIRTQNVYELHVQNTLIHDCSDGAAVLEDSNGVAFIGCNVANCPNPHFRLEGCTEFSWDGTLMDPYSAFNVNDEEWEPYAEYEY